MPSHVQFEPVQPEQRYTADHPCPICNGHQHLPQGQGVRCYGYLSSDGRCAFCAREEFAGELEPHPGNGIYMHRLDGSCGCGEEHSAQLGAAATLINETTPTGAPRVETGRQTWVIGKVGGELVEHVRVDFADGGKKYVWLRDGKSGLAGLHVKDLPLYGQDALAELPAGTTVLLVEGEKCADALRALGIPAVATVTGAGPTPSSDVLSALCGFNVALWADNDDVGHRHMDRIAGHLRALGVTVTMVTWHDAPEGGDAADFIAAGLGASDLTSLMVAASPAPIPDVVSSEFGSTPLRGAAKSEFEVISAAELLARPVVPVEWLVSRLIPLGGRATLSGPPGVGKTWLILDLARAVATGRKWLGHFPTRQGRVLLVDEENSERLLQQRLRLLLQDTDAEEIDIARAQGVRLDVPEHVARLGRLIERQRPSLTIFDSFVRFHGGEENSARDMAAVFRAVDALRAQYPITVVFADHMRKPRAGGELSDRLRGSSDKLAWVDTLLSVTTETAKPLRMRVEHSKSREDEPADAFYVDLHVEGDGARLAHGGAAGQVDHAQVVAAAAQLIREVLAGREMKREDLLATMRDRPDAPSSRFVAEALQRLIEAQDVIETPEVRDGRGRRAMVLSLAVHLPPGTGLAL